MNYKLVANKEDINKLQNKFSVSKDIFNTYINIDHTNADYVEHLLNKKVVFDNINSVVRVVS